jgi:predicted transposase YbfD/YdcC
MKKTLIESFENIEDPRESNISHTLIDIILIAILAILCGADGFNEIEDFGKSKEKWLKKYLKLRNGIPSHDTFNNVLSILEPKEFHNCFMEWVSFLQEKISKEIVSIDGKSIRRTKDNKNNKKAVHIVSAWANKNQMVLGQLKVNDKSNEITAIPELLKILDINGCIITIDAMGTQTEIAKAIVDSGAEYILPVKDNQKTLHNELETYFNNEIIPKENKELVDSARQTHMVYKFYLYVNI